MHWPLIKNLIRRLLLLPRPCVVIVKTSHEMSISLASLDHFNFPCVMIVRELLINLLNVLTEALYDVYATECRRS